MLIKRSPNGLDLPFPSEITPQAVYEQRRSSSRKRRSAPSPAAPCGKWPTAKRLPRPPPPSWPQVNPAYSAHRQADALQGRHHLQQLLRVRHRQVRTGRNAHTLKTRPWTVSIEGEVKKPMTLDIDSLMKLAPLEERVYRLRCVEGWSMVIPWVGYSLSELIKKVEPTGNAKFVEFTTAGRPQANARRDSRVLDWPYVEGLRMDEAMHPLTLLTVGMYGQVLPNQNGAPVRMVVPWKYGFKIGQVDRQDPLPQRPAAHRLGPVGAVRIWLLFERESGRGPPALVAGDRAPHRRRRLLPEKAQDPDVQRLHDVASLYAGMDLKKNLLMAWLSIRPRARSAPSRPSCLCWALIPVSQDGLSDPHRPAGRAARTHHPRARATGPCISCALPWP